MNQVFVDTPHARSGRSLNVIGSEETSSRGSQSPREVSSADREIGLHIKRYRKQKRLTQRSLAELVSITGTQLHRYETGLSRVSGGRLVAIAKALGVRSEELLGQSDERPVLLESEEEAVVMAYKSISDPSRRAAVLMILRSMAD